MAQVVSRRPLTVESRVRIRVSPQEVCGGQSGTGTGHSPNGTGFSPKTSCFPRHYHSTNATDVSSSTCRCNQKGKGVISLDLLLLY